MGVRTIRTILAAALALGMLGFGAGQASAKTLRATMSGTVEVPRGDANGSGTAVVRTNAARRRVCFDIRLRRVGQVTSGHIHAGRAGTAGDVVVALFDTATRHPQGCARGIARSVIRRINRHPRRFYVNVHNTRHPAGAVRGQLRG